MNAPTLPPSLRLLFLLLLAAVPPYSGAAEAADVDVTAHYFRAEGCPHCEHAGRFLQRLVAEEPRLSVREYEVRYDQANRDLYLDVVRALKVEEAGVPLIVIGDRALVGYHSDAWTGADISRLVRQCLASPCSDFVAALRAGRPLPATPRVRRAGALLPDTIELPLIGTVATAHLSLPLLTLTLGALDGFNPCAMWALVFLLGLLLGMKDRRRMWILGLAFLAGSGIVYFLIMAAWLNVLLTIGLIFWVRLAVALLALTGAAYYFHDFYTNRDASCTVSHAGQRQAFLARLRRVALEERLWPAFVAVVALAMAVNLIELACSAGIPAVYTQILALTPMPAWQYYGYLLLYLLVFLFDDILMFALAATTLHFASIGTRYARASRLLGGVILAAIGILLLFRPQWLAFG